MDAVQAAYLSAVERMPGISLEQFRHAMASCEVHPVDVCGEIAGAVIVKGPEIHACILPWARGRWFLKKATRILDEVISRHGYATTQATTAEGAAFVRRLGFVLDCGMYVKGPKNGH